MPPLAAEAGLKMDIKATYTVAMAIVVHYICYIPTVAFSIWFRDKEQQVLDPWLPFMVAFLSYVSGALDPVIFISRNRRNQSAIRQLLKDLCGTSAYRENPVREENRATQRQMKQREELKDSRDHAGSPNPGRASRRPTLAKIQTHQSHSDVKMAWKNCDSFPAVDQVVYAGQSTWDGEKVQDGEGESSGSLRDKSKKMKTERRKGIGTFTEVKVRPCSSSVLRLQY